MARRRRGPLSVDVWVKYRPRRNDPDKWEVGDALKPLVKECRGREVGSGTDLSTGEVDHQYGFRSYDMADKFAKVVARELEDLRDLRVYVNAEYTG